MRYSKGSYQRLTRRIAQSSPVALSAIGAAKQVALQCDRSEVESNWQMWAEHYEVSDTDKFRAALTKLGFTLQDN